jgi:succinate dehydrogenase (ubiquinone) iron-sulfur subunit
MPKKKKKRRKTLRQQPYSIGCNLFDGQIDVRNGYSKVARVLGKGDPKKQDLPTLELEDHPEGQHAQETVETYGTVTNNIKRLIKEFRIYRWSPDNPYRKPYLHSY